MVLGGPHDMTWNPDVFCVDGSGGPFTMFPSLRRTTYAAVRVDKDWPGRFDFDEVEAIVGQVPGHAQT
eukprot:561266-Lingulodinium_polyedra.AAC.1